MTQKFYGTFRELSQLIKSFGYHGTWERTEQKTKKVFRFQNGAILNWWSSNGTVHFQGNNEAKEKVQAVLVPMFFEKLRQPDMLKSRNIFWP